MLGSSTKDEFKHLNVSYEETFIRKEHEINTNNSNDTIVLNNVFIIILHNIFYYLHILTWAHV